jgi:hypothetical protein
MLTFVPASGRWKLSLAVGAIAGFVSAVAAMCRAPAAPPAAPVTASDAPAAVVAEAGPRRIPEAAPPADVAIPVLATRARVETACATAVAADACRGQADLDGDGSADCWEWHGDPDVGDGGRFRVQRGCRGAWLTTLRDDAPLWSLPDAVAGDGALLAGIIDWAVGGVRRCVDAAPGCSAIDDWLALRLDMLRHRGPDGPDRGPQAYAPRWAAAAPASTGAAAVVIPGELAGILVADERRAAAVTPPGDARKQRRLAVPRGAALYAAVAPGPMHREAECARFTVWASRRAVAVEEIESGRWSWIHDVVGAGAGDGEIERVACAAELVVAELHDDELAIRWQVVIDPDRGRWRILGVELDQWSLGDDGLVGTDTEGAPQRFPLPTLRDLLR